MSLTRGVTGPVTRPLTRAITAAGSGGSAGFSPLSLFASGEQGAWLDPSDFSVMWQDAARTMLVTAVGQPVGAINDKSGRANHATQATAAARPILRVDGNGFHYLEFDGVDDSLSTAAINFTATDKLTVFTGLRKVSDATTAVVYELSAASGVGTFALFSPQNSGATDYGLRSQGSLLSSIITAGFAAPITSVITQRGDIAADINILRVNAAQVGSSVTDQGTGNYGNHQLFIGRRGGASLPFTGRIYQLIVRGATSTAGQIADAETFVNGKTGAY